MKLNEKASYAVVYGHHSAVYQQDDKLFGPDKQELGVDKVADDEGDEVKTDKVASAEEFLTNILSQGQLPKASIYKEAVETVINWESVKKAFLNLNVIKLTVNKQEYWKLPEIAA